MHKYGRVVAHETDLVRSDMLACAALLPRATRYSNRPSARHFVRSHQQECSVAVVQRGANVMLICGNLNCRDVAPSSMSNRQTDPPLRSAGAAFPRVNECGCCAFFRKTNKIQKSPNLSVLLSNPLLQKALDDSSDDSSQ